MRWLERVAIVLADHDAGVHSITYARGGGERAAPPVPRAAPSPAVLGQSSRGETAGDGAPAGVGVAGARAVALRNCARRGMARPGTGGVVDAYAAAARRDGPRVVTSHSPRGAPVPRWW